MRQYFYRKSVRFSPRHTDVLSSVSNRASPLRHQFVSIHSDLQNVVDECEQRCKRERRNENGDEAVLND